MLDKFMPRGQNTPGSIFMVSSGKRRMLFPILFQDLPVTTEPGSDAESYADLLASLDILDISTSPELCAPGTLYLAAECETVDTSHYGTRMDGRLFIENAIAAGASAVLTDSSVSRGEYSVPFIYHEKPLSIEGLLCSRLFSAPKPANIALVTGTNGKTSVVNFCRMLWHACGLQACSVGNLGGVLTDGSLVWRRDVALSVPETVFMHKMLVDLAARDIQNVAMEATSHALFENRLDCCQGNIGAFTNLTRDHLDFHGTMEEYFRVKMTLFTEVLPRGSHAVINADSDHGERVIDICREHGHKILSFGRGGEFVKLLSNRKEGEGQILDLRVSGDSYSVPFKLFGEFQINNALCALTIAIASGVPVEEAAEALSSIDEVEGRMNTIANTEGGGRVVVDYAHTPDGLRAALSACKVFTRGEVIVVFGCNGDRDIGKRPEMGAIAVELADRVFVTDGHPRSEEPDKIRRDIMGGATGACEIAGREQAIEAAVKSMQPGDTLLIAGFGHQKFQYVRGEKRPFSEADIVSRALIKV